MKSQQIKRRNFLKDTSLIAAAFTTANMPGIAGSFLPKEMPKAQIPVDKNLNPAWIKSLYNRGTPTSYLQTKNELTYIGMPVGGINCGTVYLGGDGRLWLWDIFNKNQEGIEPKTVKWGSDVLGMGAAVRSRDGACYVEPSKDIRPLEQGFAVKIVYNGNTIFKELKTGEWDEISFEATYPIATVKYIDKNLPLSIKLQAYSPFIPLDADNSGLPATILSFEMANAGAQPMEVTLLGWLENAASKFSAKAGDGSFVNTVVKQKNMLGVVSGFKAVDANKFAGLGDTGSMCICLIKSQGNALPSITDYPINTSSFTSKSSQQAEKNVGEKLIGGISCNYTILPGKTAAANYCISWHFANVGQRINIPDARQGNYYASKFTDALAVSNYVADKFSFLSKQTFLWQKTWYDSTLPWWLLERTFMNISTLATTTSHRFASGRSWAWEGVGACEGNCTHVWQYAQAVGRIFPALEKDNRQRVDLGISLMENGGIWFRGEYDKRPAIDGQAGTVLRIYREHQMSADDQFLKENWTNIKRAVQFVIDQDRNSDGMEDTPMENTLDAVWDGEIAWIVGLCIAAVQAGQLMAHEMNDTAFAATCNQYVLQGSANMEGKLFNGEYFIHRPDAEKGRKNLGSYNTCHIDQVYGQAWAFQLGMQRVIDKEKTMSALRSLWKYNYTTDVGPYIKEHTGGRPYALPGEAGMIMNTNPANEPKPYGENASWQLGYFNECMSGFEHQVAAHLIAEGMTDEGLVLTRSIHDRYHAAKRNPYNEIECSDHYARAMASYGTFITACGFEYHGPKGFIRFAPKWDAENFKAPFITAQGWGTYSQQKNGRKQLHRLAVKNGLLRLQKISLDKLDEAPAAKISVMLGGQKIPAHINQKGNLLEVVFSKTITIQHNETLVISM